MSQLSRAVPSAVLKCRSSVFVSVLEWWLNSVFDYDSCEPLGDSALIDTGQDSYGLIYIDNLLFIIIDDLSSSIPQLFLSALS